MDKIKNKNEREMIKPKSKDTDKGKNIHEKLCDYSKVTF